MVEERRDSVVARRTVRIGQILVVDDSEVARHSICRALHSAGYLTDEASDGVQALALLESRSYDVVITDLQMPGVDGFAVLQSAKARDNGIEVLVLTGAFAGDNDAVVRALRLGANDFMAKSAFGPHQIVWSVERALDRRRQRDALGAAEARYRQLVERVQAIVWHALVPSLRFTYVSPEAEHILGYPTQAWLDEPAFWQQHLHPDDRAETISRCLRLVVARESKELEYRMVAADGRTVWLQDSIRVVSEDGEPKEIVGVMIDITQRKLLEEQLRQSQKMEAFGQLAGGVAHDFNNMLGAIVGSCELLLKDAPALDPRRGRVDEIRRAAQRGAALTRQLLAFSRKQIIQPRVLDLAAVFSGMEPMLRRLIGEHVELETAFEHARRAILADSGQIEQIILNLVVNARDAMPSGGRLVVTVTNAELDEAYARLHPDVRPGAYVALSVSDTGVGMDARTLARLFEPFFTTKPPGSGTGLGLATVYGIVRQSGGHVTVCSEPGRGSAFKVYLPRAESLEIDDPALAAGETEDHLQPVAGETILVVEDDEAMREVTCDLLGEAGYAVLDAATPEQALDLVRAHHGTIDVLLTDVVMPVMSGTQLAAEVLALSPSTRQLFMSGYPAQIIGNDPLLDPGTPFLEKPFSSETLLRTVGRVLRGSIRPTAAPGKEERVPTPGRRCRAAGLEVRPGAGEAGTDD